MDGVFLPSRELGRGERKRVLSVPSVPDFGTKGERMTVRYPGWEGWFGILTGKVYLSKKAD